MVAASALAFRHDSSKGVIVLRFISPKLFDYSFKLQSHASLSFLCQHSVVIFI